MASQGRHPDGEDAPLLNRQDDELDAALADSEERRTLERSLLRKLDRRMSILILIYILNYIDRNNASAARLRGFEEDLHLEGSQFATILSILYIGYILMQIPSNMFLNYVGKPSIYLPCCMVLWGVLSIATGFTSSFLGALITRFLLGFVEAAFFPGALFLISKWYKRNELSRRTALLSVGSLISNAFGSLIASGILDTMEGKLGFAAWRWLFFVEGALTVVVAISAIFILPDFPETSHGWLTPSEQNLAVKRLAEDGAEAAPTIGKPSSESGILYGLDMAMNDWKVWWLAGTLTAMAISLSFHAYFPTLCATMGYSPTVTLLLCAPPWIFATFIALAMSAHSDQSQERCKHIMVSLTVGIFGFVLAMLTMNKAVRYVSLFLMAQSYAGFIVFLAWASGSVSHPPAKRAIALAFINCTSQLGNVVGSYIWPSSWGPSYSLSYTICILTSSLSILMCYIFRKHLENLNVDAERRVAETDSMKGYRFML